MVITKWPQRLITTVKDVFLYWLEVASRSLKRPAEMLRGPVFMWIAFEVAAFVTAILVSLGYLDWAVAQGYLGDVAGAIRLLAIVGYASLALFILGIFYHPMKLLLSEKDLVKALRDKYEKPLLLFVGLGLYPNGNNPKVASIVLDNKSGVEVTDLSVELKRLNCFYRGVRQIVFFSPSVQTLNQAPNMRHIDRVPAYKQVGIDIVEERNDKLVLLFDDNSQYGISKINRHVDIRDVYIFEIEVEVGGKSNGVSIYPQIPYKGYVSLRRVDDSDDIEKEAGLFRFISQIEIGDGQYQQ